MLREFQQLHSLLFAIDEGGRGTEQVGAPLIRGFMTADMVKQAGHGSVVVLAKRGAWNPNPLKEFESCKRIDACIFVKW